MKPAIRVENLSKSYRLGTRTAGSYRTLRETINDSVAGAWHGLRRRFGGAVNGTANGHAKDDAFWALKDVSFEVQPGEVVGIIGRNGAGKSTLLKVLSRIVEPTTGRCEVRGRMASLLEVGTGFHPELTGRENIYMNGSILGMSRKEIDRKFDEIVEFAEIEEFLDTPVKRYSSGMYVRLAFAVAAHLDPEILIVDEVLAVGDAAFQNKCLNAMRYASQDGRTVILVSHQMNVVEKLCDRVVRLHCGRVGNAGKSKEVIAAYLGDYAHTILPTRTVDLKERPRGGTGEAVFTSMKCSGGKEEGWPHAGGPLSVEVQIEARRDLVADSLAVTLYDRSGFKLVNADTVILNRPISLRQGTNRLAICVHQLHLNPGQYIVGLWLARRPDTIFDFLDGAGELELLTDPDTELSPRANYDGPVKCHFDFEVL